MMNRIDNAARGVALILVAGALACSPEANENEEAVGAGGTRIEVSGMTALSGPAAKLGVREVNAARGDIRFAFTAAYGGDFVSFETPLDAVETKAWTSKLVHPALARGVPQLGIARDGVEYVARAGSLSVTRDGEDFEARFEAEMVPVEGPEDAEAWLAQGTAKGRWDVQCELVAESDAVFGAGVEDGATVWVLDAEAAEPFCAAVVKDAR